MSYPALAGSQGGGSRRRTLERHGDGDGEGSIHDRSRRIVQDGGTGSDHGSASRRPACAGQCDQPGGGGDQEDRVSRRRTREVLVVPDLEAGNMLAKSLSFLAEADAAGIVLGARV